MSVTLDSQPNGQPSHGGRHDRGIDRAPYEAIAMMFERNMTPEQVAKASTYRVGTLKNRLRIRRRYATAQWERWRPLVDCNWLLEAARLDDSAERDRLLSFCHGRATDAGIGMDFIRKVAQEVRRGGPPPTEWSDDDLAEALDRFADPCRLKRERWRSRG